ncbi:MmcQ/YjbR family DNA-binding protein [Zavarzinia compransoris]|nr:MmcQ/YjbR family DNA-binding protein [Zavarzinia marina]
MTRDDFNHFCASLPAASHVVQWGGSDVWKLGGKVFAICGLHGGVTFKVSETAFEILREMPGLRPAPYLASRGLKWIQHHGKPGLGDEDLRHYLTESYRMIAAALPRRTRAALGL